MAVATDAQFHVLAVDDSLVDRKLIERLLKSSSFQVTAVDSGSKALELLGLQHQEDHKRQQQMQQQSNSPSVSSYQQEIEVSLVITDYCMPGMTGYDLLKKIKESSSLKDIPVVIMSSENVPSRINRCLEEGADEFLLKPVKLSDMKKLRPRILKGKSKEQQPQLAEQNNEEPEEAHGPQEQQQLKEQRDMLLQPLQQSNQNGTTVVGTTTKTMAGSKRKAMDSEVSPSPDERPRPNYKVKGYGLTVV